VRNRLAWAPFAALTLSGALLLKVRAQEVVPLRAPLTSFTAAVGSFTAEDVRISEEERRVAGMSDYIMRLYRDPADSSAIFSLYVGYYDAQTQGKSIHSPKNCLPGAGWEPIFSGVRTITMPGGGAHTVNRYIIGNGRVKALVYYWYQGRGRIASDEYRVKYELLRDKALAGRSEEALVRIVVPLGADTSSARTAEALADRAAIATIGPLFRILPAWEPRSAL
jgi:EpsI family protein